MKKLYLIFIILIIAACNKDMPEPINEPHAIKYWVNSDSAFIRYRVHDEYYKHYVKGNWDTTFKMDAGYLFLGVTSWTIQMNVGVRVDGMTVWSESLERYAEYYDTIN